MGIVVITGIVILYFVLKFRKSVKAAIKEMEANGANTQQEVFEEDTVYTGYGDDPTFRTYTTSSTTTAENPYFSYENNVQNEPVQPKRKQHKASVQEEPIAPMSALNDDVCAIDFNLRDAVIAQTILTNEYCGDSFLQRK